MNSAATTEGAYKSTIVNQTICPAVASAISTVLGSYLLTRYCLISNLISDTALSMMGANNPGCSMSWEWTNLQCVIPSEAQVYGTNLFSSSAYDSGEAKSKLALFNFINTVEYGRHDFWCRDVATKLSFAVSSGGGYAGTSGANENIGVRPLIYIG